ncbi:MAG TPA: Crp/Fnr family transcriptional regulator [Albitalea sp.]|nr:Crp/Fnr family transcriptional regulator [Albitalea sp.]
MARKEIPPEVFLAGLALFKELDAATIARLAAGTTRRALARGEILFRQGEPASGMYVVVYGEIKLSSTTPARGTRLSGIVEAGQSFGEPVMFLERPTLVQAQAMGDALVLHLPKETVFAEIDRNPKFARRMIAGLSRRVETLVRELDRQAIGSGTERFIAYLLRRGAGHADMVVTLPAKADVASQLNLTAEHFSRILRDLVDAGLLQMHGRRITVPDPARLRAGATRGAERPGDVLDS